MNELASILQREFSTMESAALYADKIARQFGAQGLGADYTQAAKELRAAKVERPVLFNGINPIKLHATRYAGLAYANTNPVGAPLWRFVDILDADRAAVVGEQYPTRAELLADLDRYARESWGYSS